MDKPKNNSFEKSLPALFSKISDSLLVAFVNRSNIWLELSATPDHEFEFSFFSDGKFSVKFGQLLGPGLNRGKNLLVGKYR